MSDEEWTATKRFLPLFCQNIRANIDTLLKERKDV